MGGIVDDGRGAVLQVRAIKVALRLAGPSRARTFQTSTGSTVPPEPIDRHRIAGRGDLRAHEEVDGGARCDRDLICVALNLCRGCLGYFPCSCPGECVLSDNR